MSRMTVVAALLACVALTNPTALPAQAGAAALAGPTAASQAVPLHPLDTVRLGLAPASVLAPHSAPFAAARESEGTVSLAPTLARAYAARHRQPGVVLMIVGGAGILIGAITEEDVVTVVGAGVGLYGLYLYLR